MMIPLVRDVGWIWPPFTNVLHHAKWHDLSYVVDHAAQLLFSCKVGLVFLEPTVF